MIWQTFIDPALCTRLCLTLFHSVWQFGLLLFVIWCLDRIWKKQLVEQRYTLNVMGLLAGLIALPVTFLLVNVAENTNKPTAHALAFGSEPASAAQATTSDTAQIAKPIEHQTTAAPLERANQSSADNAAIVAHSPELLWLNWLQITPWVFAIYISGVGLMLARLILAMIRVNRLSTHATIIKDGPLVESLQSLTKQWTMKIVPTLAEAEQIVVPTLVGLIRPIILLPASVISGLTPHELELILAHELAHVRRYDMWVNLLQRLVESVLFFNPALWYLSRRISTLREFCCDELTCREQTVSPFEGKVRYATALLRVVELSKPNCANTPELTSLAASGHSPSEVRRRVARLLGEPLREPLRITRSVTYAAIVLLLIGGPAIWSTYAETNESPEIVQQESEATTDADSTKQFSFGSKIEVLSIGTFDEKPERWWNAKGALQAPRPYQIEGAKVFLSDNQIGRQLVFRIHDLPQRATVKWSLSIKGSSADGDVVFNGKDGPPGYYSKVFSTRDDMQSVDLRVGLASGKWTTVTDGNKTASSTATRDNQGILFSGAFTQKNEFTKKRELVTVVTHSFKESDVRVIAIDSKGKEHTASKSAMQFAGGTVKVRQTRWYFRNLDLENFDHFEFQTRDFEWVDFKNLPLHPSKPPVTSAEINSKPENHKVQKTEKTIPTAKISIVIAKHVILLEGKEIITWEELDNFFGTLPDTSLVTPAYYITRGAMGTGLYKSTKEKMWELRRKYKFSGHSEGSLWPRTDFRYDNIKTADDLRPSPDQKLTGTIVNQKDEPIEGAEIALILPVDESIGYKTYHVALVQGSIRNRLEHVMTTSDSAGQFDLFPPKEVKYYILAMHPEAGFSLVRSDQIQADKKIKLLPWAGLKTKLDELPNEKQTVDLTNQIKAHQGWPEITFNQYWSDLPQDVQEQGFVYNQIPPLYRATISRSFKQPDGGGISLPGASVNMLPGEKRELGLGPLSNKQRSLLEGMRDSSRKRQRRLEEKPKVKAKP